MTTIVALHTPGKGTWIGSDNQVTAGVRKRHLPNGKWVRHGQWAAGSAGIYSMNVLLGEYAKDLFDDLESPFAFGQRILELAKGHGWEIGDPEGGGPQVDCCMLLASAEGVWEFSGDMSPLAIRPNELTALGSGGSYATGAGWVTPHMAPRKRVEIAIETACTLDIYSGGEPWIEHLPPAKAPRPRG